MSYGISKLTLYFSQEPLKIDQHAPNLLVTLDSKGRAWSLQIEETLLKTLIFQLLQMRQTVTNHNIEAFVISKGGENNLKLKSGSVYNIRIAFGFNHDTMKSEGSSKLSVNPKIHNWHQYLKNLTVKSQLLLYGELSNFKDVIVQENSTRDYVYLLVDIDSIEETQEEKIILNKIEKIGTNVMLPKGIG